MTPMAASAVSAIHGAASAAMSAVHAAAPVAASAPRWFENGSLTFELVKGLPTTLVAVFVAYVAWRQYQVALEQKRVARVKLNLDLFEQRYEVFERTWAMLSSAIQPLEDPRKVEIEFHNLRPRARFLFGAEVAEYMAEVSRRCIDQQTIMALTRQSGGFMRPEDIQRHADNSNWLFDQAGTGARELFGRYLDFSEWRGH